MESLEHIVNKLTTIAEELNDAAMSVLSEAIAEGRHERPAIEKSISQARRAVEKAIHHLSGTNTD